MSRPELINLEPSDAARVRLAALARATTRNVNERALTDGETLFRAVFENAPNGMVLATPDGRTLKANRAICALLGYTEPELLAMSLWDLTYPDDIAVNLADMERALAGEIDTYSLEKRYITRAGEIVWVHLSGSLVRDPSDAPLYFISQTQDISERKAAEDELAATHHQTQHVLERITDGFYALDWDWRFTYINAAAEKIFGRPRADLLGKHVWSEFASAIETPVYAAYQNAMAEGAPTDLEFFYPAFNAWYQVFAYPSVDGLSVFFRDVTVSRQLAEELRTSEAKYRALVEQLPAVIYVQANDERQTATYFSPQFETLTGFSMAEIMDQPPGEHWHEFLHPDDRAHVAADEAQSVATGEPFRSKYRLARRDGGYVWVRDECVPVLDEAGAIVAWQGVLLDITEQIQAEQALAASETRFRTAFENAPIGMALTSSALRVLQVNRALCAMLGYDADQIVGGTLRELTHPDDVLANRELIEQTLAEGPDRFELEKRYLHRDGHVVWAHLQVSLVRDDHGTPLYFISQIQDITARKRAEEDLRSALDAAQAASRAKSQFLAMMSHELHTPLQAVVGYAESLLAGHAGTLTPVQREDIDYIQQGGSRMMTLIGQMLDLSRIEAGAIRLSVEPINLSRILEQVRQDVALQVNAKGLDLTIDVPSSLPEVLGDPVRLRQILLNLVGNAIKFTERGSVLVRATTCAAGVAVMIRDTGIGIAPEELPHIFEEFRQVDSSLTRRHGGAGLGLAIAQKLAALMGSHITVNSEAGVGSTLTLHLVTVPP